jgi:hypothetical protein
MAISNALAAAAAQSWSTISITSLSFIEVADRPV